MAQPPVCEAEVPAPAGPVRGGRPSLTAYFELGKARLSALIVFTAAVGFVLASRGSVDWLRLGWTVLGTGLAALGANALNQWWEVERDARMVRTRTRPLPERRVNRRAALVLAAAVGLAGPMLLAATTNVLAGVLALTALLIHVLAYTPLKARTPANTLVGAIVGALPPLLGWAAAAGRLGAGGWLLAGILFLWQIPHFLALAWMYREDYARGGFRMLPVIDPHGHLTGCVAVLYTLALVPLTLMLTLVGTAGWLYAGGAVVLGGGLLLVGVGLERSRTNAAARRLFVASVIYLPLLLGLMVTDRHPVGTASASERSHAVATAGARGSGGERASVQDGASSVNAEQETAFAPI